MRTVDYPVDRKKDMVVASRYNVSPREIEDVLYMLDAVIPKTAANGKIRRRSLRDR